MGVLNINKVVRVDYTEKVTHLSNDLKKRSIHSLEEGHSRQKTANTKALRWKHAVYLKWSEGESLRHSRNQIMYGL